MIPLDRTQAPPFQLSADYSLPLPEVLSFSGGQPLYAFRGIQQQVVKLEMVFASGKWYEPKSGVSHFASQLLRKGTKTRTSFQIASALDQLGAHVEIVAGFDTATVSLFALHKQFFPALDILLDIVTSPGFPDDEVRQEKDIFIQNLRVNNEKTSVVASKEIRKVIFGANHPYGNSTEEMDVQQIISSDLANFFRVHHKLHSAYLVGPLSDQELTELVRLIAPPSPSKQAKESPSLVRGHSSRIEKTGSVQASIRLGKTSIRKSNHSDYFDAVMVNHLLGGYFGSRLMKNIREEKGLTYGIYSALHHFHHASFWVIAAEVNQQNVQQALDEIRNEIKLLQHVPVTSNELEVARNYFIGSWQSDNATLFAVAEKVRGMHEFGLPADYYKFLLSHLKQMTPHQVQVAAQKHLGVDDLLEVSVG